MNLFNVRRFIEHVFPLFLTHLNAFESAINPVKVRVSEFLQLFGLGIRSGVSKSCLILDCSKSHQDLIQNFARERLMKSSKKCRKALLKSSFFEIQRASSILHRNLSLEVTYCKDRFFQQGYCIGGRPVPVSNSIDSRRFFRTPLLATSDSIRGDNCKYRSDRLNPSSYIAGLMRLVMNERCTCDDGAEQSQRPNPLVLFHFDSPFRGILA